MRFDDSLRTVLSGETASDVGAQAAWRQLVDLIGRRRVKADAAAIDRLRDLRPSVSVPVRAASARALAFAQPPAALVALFGEDVPAVAAPVLRSAMLDAADWSAILPHLSPTGRSVLRHRRDLPAETVRALEVFGSTDFVLEDASAEPQPQLAAPAPESSAPNTVPVSPAPDLDAEAKEDSPSEIADMVARIDAFNRTRERPLPAAAPVAEPASATTFRFETDAGAVIRWVEGATRAALVGISLAHAAVQGHAQVDGGVAGACRRRSSFRDARLLVGGMSDAAGDWRLSALPAFDPASGRFMGYRGTARRPRADESAEPRRNQAASESLRQLVHELRTPTNAIAGFAELIHSELLGPVAEPYRDHASAILSRTSALVQAIGDLDTAARIEGGALELRPKVLPLRPIVLRALADLQPLADLRGAAVTLLPDGGSGPVLADEAALERLVGRLLSALVSATARDERVTVAIGEAADAVTLAVDLPTLLDATDETADDEAAPLLGTAFALRLATNLAAELGGALVADSRSLTLRLPAAVDRDMGQVSTH